MSFPSKPEAWLMSLPQDVRTWFYALDRVIRKSADAIDSADGDLIGGESVAAVVPGPVTLTTLADAQTAINALQDGLRSL